MQPYEDGMEDVKLRCNASGLLRAGEELDSRVDGAERHQDGRYESSECDDYYDSSYFGVSFDEKKEATKKRKAKDKEEQVTRWNRTVDSGDPVLGDFVSKVSGLNQPLLKSLCLANNLLVSGIKPQLKLRLMNCHLYGHSGTCPKCQYSRMKLVFENPDSCEPTHVECTFLHLWPPPRHMCKFGKQLIVGDRALMLPQKLKDNSAGTLRSVGIEVGAAAAGGGGGDSR